MQPYVMLIATCTQRRFFLNCNREAIASLLKLPKLEIAAVEPLAIPEETAGQLNIVHPRIVQVEFLVAETLEHFRRVPFPIAGLTYKCTA